VWSKLSILLKKHFHHFHHVHTLMIILDDAKIYGRHNQQCNDLYGEFYLLSILKTMPQLQSLSMYQTSDHIHPPSLLFFNAANFSTAHHLHTLRMSKSSYQFLASLLNNGHVPRLRYLRVTFRDSSPWPIRWVIHYFNQSTIYFIELRSGEVDEESTRCLGPTMNHHFRCPINLFRNCAKFISSSTG
jgi:hypothetical protein